MFISLTLTITLLTAAQAWLYDGATPVDCIEDWGPWRCAGNEKQYRENIIFRHPTVNGAPCVNEGRIEFNENSCEPTLDDKTRSVEKFWLNHDNGLTSGSRSGRESGLKRDILILLDMSGSISTTAFNEVKVILITDGQPTDASEVEVEQEAQRLKNMGVEVFAFGIDETHAINFDHLKKVVSPKDTSHVFHIEGVQEFTEIVEMIRAQAESPHNTGQCIDLGYHPDQ
ncbi:hypothetical protein Bbelb_187720 [Branchiostoma belcheri]|nr:hypothetical protein Bbelb_187720 [Branchiostoma belcheri]